MSKLVEGDVVICIDDHNSNYLRKLGKYTVHGVGKGNNSDMVSLLNQNNQLIGNGELFFMTRFVKINEFVPGDIDAAKKLLEDAGYVVTKPKPVPKFGQLWLGQELRPFMVSGYDPGLQRVYGVYKGDSVISYQHLDLLHRDYDLDKS